MYFYIPDLTSGQIHTPDSAHLVSCRVANGDQIQATDLNGQLATLKITAADLKKGIFSFNLVSSLVTHPKPTKNILLQAKIDKLYLEKLVEIIPLASIDEVVFFDSEFSQKGQKINLERLDRILIRSCEQSHTVFKPKLIIHADKSKLADILENHRPTVLEGKTPTNIQDQIPDIKLEKSVLVGPEGGWSEKELILFKSKNLQFQNLGETVYPAWMAGFVWFQRRLD
jgi:16S rRNA (uracil1498-N3)-methyltransferase